ncbi:box C D snoRNA 1 [Micractinium conductrix]|uniref:Box C/D snoRNA protein 1 n=1 Tax=Micractinium conductrix TaxID=554055 RepID=A0A2P6VFX6_9CHLO|nr:box C D snoRNA 1 [Micractinium conductrix]|eukprot:PSC72977.1 box C D snoRNA 1 [Micractinium conductrix]
MAAEEPQACQECWQSAAKYTCPRCERRTCSLACVKAHKEASGCSGKRDRTGFVGRASFDERTFFSDYRFLEEVQLAEDVAKRSKPPAPKLELPQFLQTLQYQARRRGVQLHILSPGMEKRRSNTTRYDGRMQTLQWHVEWAFPAADGVKVADHKAHENTLVSELLAAHLALQPGAAARHHALREHREAGLEALTVVMRKERTPANAVQYHEIDITRPLRTQLAGKVVVEFPTFLVLLRRERDEYGVLPQPAPAQAGGGTEPATAAAAAEAAAAAGEETEPVAAEVHTEPPMPAAATAGAGASSAAGAGGGQGPDLAAVLAAMSADAAALAGGT